MKALVLSGGSGTRLWPLTHTSPKQLVPVANKPVLHHALEDIARAGITEVGIVVGESAFEIQEAVGDGSKFGLEVTYLTQARPLGLAHAVLVARDYLGDDDFVMYLGDSFATGGATCLVRDFRADRTGARLLLTRVPDPTAFGVAEVAADGRILGLEEKPVRPKSDMAVVGVYLFTSVVHEAVRAIAPSGRGELEITDAVQWLIDNGHEVQSTCFHGFWQDTGDALGVLEANRSVLETVERRIVGTVDADSEVVGRVSIEAGAQVRGSRIVGPAVIGCNTVISNSYVGPYTSIAEGCRVQDTEIEYSVVLREARLDGVGRLRASLIGRNASVTPAVRKPVSNRLILGDHSEVQISS